MHAASVDDGVHRRQVPLGWAELPACRAARRPRRGARSCEKSGVSKEQIDDIAGQYARSERAVFAWTMGVTHHLHGAATVQAIAQLALHAAAWSAGPAPACSRSAATRTSRAWARWA